jgi:hypothetical protein
MGTVKKERNRDVYKEVVENSRFIGLAREGWMASWDS